MPWCRVRCRRGQQLCHRRHEACPALRDPRLRGQVRGLHGLHQPDPLLLLLPQDAHWRPAHWWVAPRACCFVLAAVPWLPAVGAAAHPVRTVTGPPCSCVPLDLPATQPLIAWLSWCLFLNCKPTDCCVLLSAGFAREKGGGQLVHFPHPLAPLPSHAPAPTRANGWRAWGLLHLRASWCCMCGFHGLQSCSKRADARSAAATQWHTYTEPDMHPLLPLATLPADYNPGWWFSNGYSTETVSLQVSKCRCCLPLPPPLPPILQHAQALVPCARAVRGSLVMMSPRMHCAVSRKRQCF